MVKHIENKTCVGTGLICLDILKRGKDEQMAYLSLGGTCGNVMMILSHLMWHVFPIARLDNTPQAMILKGEMELCGVNTMFVSTNDGLTPIIVQHNTIDKYGNPRHKFETRGEDGSFIFNFKPITVRQAKDIVKEINFTPFVFFLDKIFPAAIYLADYFKSKGSLIYFEPSCKVTTRDFSRCVEVSDIVKFSNQRIEDISFTTNYADKLFVQTLGERGLRFSLCGGEWQQIAPIENTNVVDSSGAGDWTTAVFLDGLSTENIHSITNMTPTLVGKLLKGAQKIASRSCSYEGSRGMMIAESME